MKPRFLTFVSRPEEAADWARRLPDLTLTWAGHAAFQPGMLVFTPRRPGVFLEELEAEHRRSPFSGVLNRREKYVIPACLAARRLKLPPAALRSAPVRDKLVMRRALGGRAELLREPPFEVSTDLFPAVLKPRFGFNSRGVVRVEDPRDLVCQFRRQQAFFRRLRRPDSACLDFIVEPWIGGTEHTAETLVVQGQVRWILLSDKLPMKAPYHVEVGDLSPTRLGEADQARVRRAVEQAVTRLGIHHGWAHVEIKLEGHQAVVLEAAARMGGGTHEELHQELYGLDRARILADIQLGRPLPPAPAPQGGAAVLRVVSEALGYVSLPGSLRDQVEAAGARLLWPEGPVSRLVIGPPYGYKNTVYEIMAQDATPEAALEKVREASKRVRLFRLPLPGALYFLGCRLLCGRVPLDG